MYWEGYLKPTYQQVLKNSINRLKLYFCVWYNVLLVIECLIKVSRDQKKKEEVEEEEEKEEKEGAEKKLSVVLEEKN